MKQSFHLCNMNTWCTRYRIARASPKFYCSNRMNSERGISKNTNQPKMSTMKSLSIGCLKKKTLNERWDDAKKINKNKRAAYTELELFHSIWISLIKEEMKKMLCLCVCTSVCACVSERVSLLWVFMCVRVCV